MIYTYFIMTKRKQQKKFDFLFFCLQNVCIEKLLNNSNPNTIFIERNKSKSYPFQNEENETNMKKNSNFENHQLLLNEDLLIDVFNLSQDSRKSRKMSDYHYKDKSYC